jgi:hypothetical protein
MEHNFKVPHQPRYNGKPFTYSPECRKCHLWRKWDGFITMAGGLFLLSLLVGYPFWIAFFFWITGNLH